MINFADHIWGLLQEFDFYQLWWNKAIHDGERPRPSPSSTPWRRNTRRSTPMAT